MRRFDVRFQFKFPLCPIHDVQDILKYIIAIFLSNYDVHSGMYTIPDLEEATYRRRPMEERLNVGSFHHLRRKIRIVSITGAA